MESKDTKKKSNEGNKKKTKDINKLKTEEKEQNIEKSETNKKSEQKGLVHPISKEPVKNTTSTDSGDSHNFSGKASNHTETDNAHKPNHSGNDSLSFHNNSNNFKSTNGHRKSGSHEERMKPFIPPILSNKISSSAETRISPGDTASVELNPNPSPSKHKIVPQWRTPSPEKKPQRNNGTKKRNSKHLIDAELGTEHTSPQAVTLRQKPSYLRSQSSDFQFSDYDIKTKTPSFTTVLNSMENINITYQGGSVTPSDTSSRTTSPKHINNLSQSRPVSQYDNVPYPYHPSEYPDVPVIPESPVSFDHVHGRLEVGGYIGQNT